MRIGLTGGTGFLGRHLARSLVARGDTVTVFTRSVARARPQTGVSFAEWNPRAEPLSPSVLSSLDAVVHLAGETVFGLWTGGKKRRIRESRVLSTRNVVAGLEQASPRPGIFISGSAVGYYGHQNDTKLTETSPGGQGFLADVCREWEAAAQPAANLGTRLVLLRTSLPLSADGGFLNTILPSFRWGLGATLGSGRQWMPWIHLEDWIGLTQFALDTESVSGALNATGPQPARNHAFTQQLAKALNRSAWFRVPSPFLTAFLGDLARETALVSQRVIPARAVELGFAFQQPELEPALKDLLS